MKTVLTIAASDSSSGAGIQADLAVFRELGTYGFCAVTNVTAQNSCGVAKIAKVPPRIIAAQIDAVTRDFEVNACKIGMLYFPQAVTTVAGRIKRREIPNVVLDPVMSAKHGEVLLTEQAIKRIKRFLIPLVKVITPNYHEAYLLTGVKVRNGDSACEAAKVLVEMGAQYALVKGGHAENEPVDVLFDGKNFHQFVGRRIEKQMHGTGCILSAAIAARLALGDDVVSAVEFAKAYVTSAIDHSVTMGKARMSYYVGSWSVTNG
jgi:hydroxymethylpyrimidine/phosphomethylpyrimidine kinase